MKSPGPELRDIHLPAEPSWWPPAPGWWILALLAIAVIFWCIVLLRRRLSLRRWQKQILGELDRIDAGAESAKHAPIVISELSQLLRRASRLVDVNASSLRGNAWLGFLDSILGGDEFSNGPGRNLLDGPYQREAHVDVKPLLDLVRRWLKRVVETRVPHV